MIRHLSIALVVVAVTQGCQTGGRQLGGSGKDDGGSVSIDATGPGTGAGGAAGGQGIGGAHAGGGTGGQQTSGTGGGAVAGPDVSGRWAMFAFEDPVAVVLDETNNALQGSGCCGGLSDIPGACCGAVTGQIAGRRASFGFPTGVLGPYTYSTTAFVSADGQRMAGTFTVGGPDTLPVAWVRIGPTERWLPEADRTLSDILRARAAGYALSLSDVAAAGTDFSTQQTYRLSVLERFVSGDLGAYWDRELSWRADEQTLVVGPVPETAPGLPVALWLHFDGSTLASVEAAMASGARYRFQATASQP